MDSSGLAKLAVWDAHFIDAAELLLSLAEAENANNSNNATGTFVGLFSLIPGLAETQSVPSRRLAVLAEALDADSPERRRIALSACESALSTMRSFRMIGNEYQGLRRKIDFWWPQTYEEMYQARLAVWQLLESKLNSWEGDDRGA